MQRNNVITDREILSHVCPNCFVRAKAVCVDNRGKPRELFHPERIRIAQERAIVRLFGTILDHTERSLILYYAYIMLCDSVSTKAKEILGVDMQSEQIQAYFAKQAIEELQRDGLLKKPNGESTKTSGPSASRN